MTETEEVQDDRCHCGKESVVGVHSTNGGQVVDKYFCDDHWKKKDKKE